MALGPHRLLSLQSTGGGSRLNRRTNKETLVWKVHLLLLFLLGRFSRAKRTTSPPSAPGTVHSLQVRRECSRLEHLGGQSSQAQTRLLAQRWILDLKEQLTAAKTQMLILLLHNVGGLPYPREAWRVKAPQQRANRFLVNIQFSTVQLFNCSVHFFPSGKYCSFSVG